MHSAPSQAGQLLQLLHGSNTAITSSSHLRLSRQAGSLGQLLALPRVKGRLKVVPQELQKMKPLASSTPSRREHQWVKISALPAASWHVLLLPDRCSEEGQLWELGTGIGIGSFN